MTDASIFTNITFECNVDIQGMNITNNSAQFSVFRELDVEFNVNVAGELNLHHVSSLV